MSWQPSANIDNLKQRAKLIAKIRAFFDQSGAIEVETPLLASASASDPWVDSLTVVDHKATHKTKRFLQTSPEQHMKRLLSAGSGDIYQICKAFRRDQSGKLHNCEFTILEWYRIGWSLAAIAEETCRLLQQIAKAPEGIRTSSYSSLFIEQLGCDPLSLEGKQIHQCLPVKLQEETTGLNKNELTDYLFASQIEPLLGNDRLDLVTDFPPWMAALAQTHQDQYGRLTSQRFEVYWQGVELANGYQELVDAQIMHQRYQHDCHIRATNNMQPMPYMDKLDQAMREGMPQSCGVALGVDRLIMLACQTSSIDQVIAFPDNIA